MQKTSILKNLDIHDMLTLAKEAEMSAHGKGKIKV